MRCKVRERAITTGIKDTVTATYLLYPEYCPSLLHVQSSLLRKHWQGLGVQGLATRKDHWHAFCSLPHHPSLENDLPSLSKLFSQTWNNALLFLAMAHPLNDRNCRHLYWYVCYGLVVRWACLNRDNDRICFPPTTAIPVWMISFLHLRTTKLSVWIGGVGYVCWEERKMLVKSVKRLWQ